MGSESGREIVNVFRGGRSVKRGNSGHVTHCSLLQAKPCAQQTFWSLPNLLIMPINSFLA